MWANTETGVMTEAAVSLRVGVLLSCPLSSRTLEAGGGS